MSALILLAPSFPKSCASAVDHQRAQALSFDISDTALEAAAGRTKYKAGGQTISFCSGIDTCPS
jgi:hypothetical protein